MNRALQALWASETRPGFAVRSFRTRSLLYDSLLSCQFVVIDGIPDGDYHLISTTHAERVVREGDYADNTIITLLRISEDEVTVLVKDEF